MKFKKITAIAAGALLVGMTLGNAFALSPSDSQFDAVVYGSQSQATDKTAATSIADWLNLGTTTSGSLSGDGDSYQIGSGSTKFHIGEGFLDAKASSITGDHLTTLLADGTYVDNDNDEFKYTQKVEIINNTLTLWEDSDYADDTPTLGLKITSGTPVLNYTLTMTETPTWEDLATSTLHLMGKDYYVLATNFPTNTTITLLDSAQEATISEGQTKNLLGHDISISWISSTSVVMTVDGVETNSLAESETQKLSDGSYIGIQDIRMGSRDTDVGSVKFSIGSGKLLLTNNANVQLNTVSVDGLTATLGGATSTNYLTNIVIKWAAPEDTFITPTSEAVMPGFGALKLSMTGITYPEEEEIVIDGGDYIVLKNFPLTSGATDIPIAYWDKTNDWFDAVGKGTENSKVVFAANASNVTMDYDLEREFIASWTNGLDSESYLMKLSDPEPVYNKTTFYYKSNGEWVEARKDAQDGTEFSVGEVTITVGEVNAGGYNNNVVNFLGGTGVSFNTLYTDKGMKVLIPYRGFAANGTEISFNVSAANTFGNDLLACDNLNVTNNLLIQSPVIYNKTSTPTVLADTGTCAQRDITLVFTEANKEGNLGYGGNITVVINRTGTAGDDLVDVQSYAVANAEAYSATGSGIQMGSTKEYHNYVYSDLGTKLVWDRNTEPENLAITYHGGETYGNVYITSSEVTATTSTGSMVFMDSEKTSWQGYDVVLVGGSCINTATATALKVASTTCGTAFTDATGVGTGEYMIEVIDSAFTTGKLAMVVAGYEKAETTAGATYLRTNGASIDAVAGNKYVGIVNAVTGADIVNKV